MRYAITLSKAVAVGGMALLCLAAAPATPEVQPHIAPILVGALRVLLLTAVFFTCVAMFKIPGTVVIELVALTLLAALVVPPLYSGTGQWYEVIAVVLGLVLIGIELFVIPGFGATGIAGLLLLGAGLVMLFVPNPNQTVSIVNDVRNALIVVISGAAGGLVAVGALARFLPAMPRARRLFLTTTVGSLEHEKILAGDVGTTISALRPMGTAQFGTVTVEALSARSAIPVGTKVRVIAYHDGVATVEPIDSSEGKSL